jgi:hypothetical protein
LQLLPTQLQALLLKAAGWVILLTLPQIAFGMDRGTDPATAEVKPSILAAPASAPSPAMESKAFALPDAMPDEPPAEFKIPSSLLAYYRSIRDQFLDQMFPDPLGLVRFWFDDGTGKGSSQAAWRKAYEGHAWYPGIWGARFPDEDPRGK